LFVVAACLLVVPACLLLIRFCSLFIVQTCLLLSRFCCCCGISCSRINLGVVVPNLTPVGHPMGDRLDSKVDSGST
jgi:hypothetical protein